MTGGRDPGREAETRRPSDPGSRTRRDEDLRHAGTITARPADDLASADGAEAAPADAVHVDAFADGAPAAAADEAYDGVPEPEPTTAEQAVPWLIGIILLLIGIVIVLLAVIFVTPGAAFGGEWLGAAQSWRP